MIVLLSLAPATSAGATECGDDGDFCTYQDTITARMSGVEFVTVPSAPDPREYHYSKACYVDDEVRLADGCVGGTIPPPAEGCETGTMAMPRWSRLRDSGDGTPGAWVLEAGYTCPGDSEYPITFDDFAQLPIAPSPLELQPPTGWVYAGLDTIAFTEDSVQGFEVTLRDAHFYIGAIPVEFEWDFGDGSDPIVTTDPGKPWPDHTFAHQYRASGTVTPVLTTRWKGAFKQGTTGQWEEIPGTGETITTGSPITVHTARTRLVEDDLG